MALRAFLLFLESEKIESPHPIASVTMNHFIRFPSWMLANGFKKSTAVVYSSGSKFFLDWLVIEGHLLPSYEENLRYQKSVEALHKRREEKLPRTPKEGDVAKMLKAVEELEKRSPAKERNIALILFLYSTGCRNEECTKLRVKDIDLVNKRAFVQGKGEQEAIVFFNQETADALETYLKTRKWRDKNHPIFARHDNAAGKKKVAISTNTVRRVIDDVMKLAGVEKGTFSPHRFRHAFAIDLLRKTKNLALVQDLMRHKSPTTTRRYAKISDEEAEKEYRENYDK